MKYKRSGGEGCREEEPKQRTDKGRWGLHLHTLRSGEVPIRIHRRKVSGPDVRLCGFDDGLLY